MRRCHFLPAMLLVVLAAQPRVAAAQQPICSAPASGEVLRTSCRSWAAAAVARWLEDFTVDQLWKPPLPPFERSWSQVVAPFASKNLPETEAFRVAARNLDPLRFTRLDRTTGTVLSDLTSAPRTVEVQAEGFGPAATVQLRLPEVLEGGYWRGPDALQVAFWKHHRLGLRVAASGATLVDGEVQCVSLSSEGLLVRFADAAAPAVFVRLRDCEP